MSKFVAGDLVTLSAAGRTNHHNHTVKGLIGIVMENRGNHTYPYQVKWIGKTEYSTQDPHLPMKEYEIKFAKAGDL